MRTPNGDWVALASVAHWSTRQGFEAPRHAESQLAVEVNATVANSNEILAGLGDATMPALERKYGIHGSFQGRAADQRETMADMKTGLVLGLALIYIVLAWVFGHYGWPIIIMRAIPFGLAFTTVLALLWLPAMLSFYESGHVRLMRLLGRPATA